MIVLTETTLIAAPLERCFDLARSIEVHLAGNIHFGEQAVALKGSSDRDSAAGGLLTLGDSITWQARHFFSRQRLTTRVTAFEPLHCFQETMVHGIFNSMQHDHHFQSILNDGSDSLTAMHDVFRFSAPIPMLGRLVETLFLRNYMQNLLRERNAVIKQIAESTEGLWRRYLCPAAVGAI